MRIVFNQNGVVTSSNLQETGDSIRQGSIGNVLSAKFTSFSNTNNVATLNFTRSDGSKVSNVMMSAKSGTTDEFTVKFNDRWYFALEGQTTLTIFIRDGGGNVLAQGQFQFSIAQSDFDGDAVPSITPDQYDDLVALINSKHADSLNFTTYNASGKKLSDLISDLSITHPRGMRLVYFTGLSLTNGGYFQLVLASAVVNGTTVYYVEAEHWSSGQYASTDRWFASQITDMFLDDLFQRTSPYYAPYVQMEIQFDVATATYQELYDRIQGRVSICHFYNGSTSLSLWLVKLANYNYLFVPLTHDANGMRDRWQGTASSGSVLLSSLLVKENNANYHPLLIKGDAIEYYSYNASGKTIEDLYNLTGGKVSCLRLSGISQTGDYIAIIFRTGSVGSYVYSIEIERYTSGQRTAQDRWIARGLPGSTSVDTLLTAYNDYYAPYLVNGNVFDYDTATFADIHNEIGVVPHIIQLRGTGTYSGFYLVKLTDTNDFCAQRIVSSRSCFDRWYGRVSDETTLFKDVLANPSYHHPFLEAETFDSMISPNASTSNKLIDKDYVDGAIADSVSNVYKFQGTKTVAQMNALTLSPTMQGYVYNVSDSGNLVINGVSVQVLAGDNVALQVEGSGGSYTYSWDKLAGTFEIDLSNYYDKSETDTLLATKANSADVYNKTQIDTEFAKSFVYGGFNTISDANNAELNKFYWISNQTANFPNNDSKVGLLMNMGYSSTYRTQIYILGYGTNAPKYYVRNIVGTSWSNWYELAREEGLLRNTRQNYDVGPNDADNAVNNTFICVVNKTTNYPYENASGFLYTNYSLADDKYGVQMFIARTTNNMTNRPTIYVRSKNNNVFYEWQKLAIEGNPTIQLSMFKSIAACGDSYTAGYSVDKDGTTREKAYQNSWIRTLARKNGFFGGIYAKTGVTTSGWLTDSDCLPALQADSNHYDLYIIFLGFNDSVSGFGTDEDIDLENPLDSANSSCGNFAKIKYYIEQKDPNAKIVICKLPYGGANTSEQVDAKNPLIEACATKLGVGCASIANFRASNDNIYMQANHGTRVGYSYLASAIEYGVCKALAMNYYVGFDYDSSENTNKNYELFLKKLYDGVSGNSGGYAKQDQVLNIINASDITDNTLSAEQYALIRNGKPTIIKGTFLNMLNPILLTSSYLEAFGMIIGANSTGNYTRVQYYEIYPSGDNHVIQIYSNKRIELRNIYDINGKEIPNYPSSTGTFVLKCIDGTLTWVQEQ